MPKKHAVVLRGPMGVGKSTVADILCQQLMSGEKVILDNWWYPGQMRYGGGLPRYFVLRHRTETTIVIEIGCGEPPDLCQPGATTGALEWNEVLEGQGRAVYLFQLWAEWPTIRANMQV